MTSLSLLYLAVDTGRRSSGVLFQPDYSPLTLLGNIPVAKHIVDTKNNNDHISNVYIVCHPSHVLYSSYSVFSGIEFIPIFNSENPIQSIYQAINHVKTDWVHISPITSIINSRLEPRYESFFEEKLRFPCSWSSLDISSGFPTYLPRNLNIQRQTHAFTGRFTAKVEFIQHASLNLLSSGSSDLIYYLYHHNFCSIDTLSFVDWIDLGHIESVYYARSHSFSSRHFNSIELLPNSVLRKVSTNGLKLRSQAEFVSQLPPNLKRFFPATINHGPLFSSSSLKYFYEMDYKCFSNLSEHFLSSSLTLSQSNHLFDHLFLILKDFSDTYGLRQLQSSQYSTKIINRRSSLLALIDESSDNECLKFIYENSILVNGVTLPSLKSTFEELLEFFLVYERSCFSSVSHGDFCFNNILYDPISRQIYLIDPRGLSEDDFSLLYQDQFYDIAKLDHSLSFGYDSITFGFFKLDRNLLSDSFTFSIYAPDCRQEMTSQFLDRIINSNFSNYLNLRKYLVSSLFASMIPLHSEDMAKCSAFAILASVILHDKSDSLYGIFS